MEKEHFISILSKYLQGDASVEEQNFLYGYYALFMADEDVMLLISEEVKEKLKANVKAGIDERIGEGIEKIGGLTFNEREPLIVSPKPVRLWPRIAAISTAWKIAAAVAAIVFGVWLFNSDTGVLKQVQDDVLVNDIKPGKNTATLTLANGKTIHLSDAKTGVVIGDDKLTYNDNTVISSADPSSRTEGRDLSSGGKDLSHAFEMTSVSTPRGGTYQVVLPDGTQVWLNADSKISFPSQFNGKERKILLEGEAYFEVVKDKTKPFIVATGNQEVTVLGTHFNINAYKDESNTKTTLLEGSVSVRHAEFISGSRNSKGGGPDLRQDDVVLKPNQQSIQNPDGGMQVRNVDVAEALDWKNGDFIFKEEPLAAIMQRVGRWYDVEVVYDKDVDQRQTFGGKVSRKRNISQVIKALQATQALKFKIEGKKVYVTN